MRVLVLTFALAGCGVDHERIAERCSKVTDENWRSPRWDQPSQKMCEFWAPTAILVDFEPCVFGGMPGYCESQKDGVRIYFLSGPTFLIFSEDLPQVEPHITYIR